MVEHLAGALGVRQFMNVGAQVPTGPKVHEVAQRIAPSSRVVYVFNDPTVLATPTRCSRAARRAPRHSSTAACATRTSSCARLEDTLDLQQPLAVLLYIVIQFLDQLEAGCRLVADVLDRVPSGTYLMIGHAASDLGDDMVAFARRLNEAGADPQGWAMYPRPYAEVSRLFDGLDLVEPGLVPVHQWLRHHGMTVPTGDMTVPAYGGLATKP